VALDAVLWLAGAALIVLGVFQMRAPLARYRALQATEANLRRYDDWRGSRLVDDSERTGADEMKDYLRLRVRLWSVVVIVGIVLVVAGFIVG
jgi:uncharacterized membrane protein HdeD (DUF308 family)